MPLSSVGSFRFVADSGFPVTATLSGDGKWASDVSELATYLNLIYSPLKSYSPAYGPFGTMHVLLAAKAFRAEAHLEHTPASSPERIY